MRQLLVVDDIAANRIMLQMFLEQHGYRVDHAASGREAVDMAKAQQYDGILMDLHMPGLDGFSAARLIRSEESPNARTLIVAVTACVGAETRDKCYAAGMDAYFTKPLELRGFCRTLDALIRARAPGIPAPAIPACAG